MLEAAAAVDRSDFKEYRSIRVTGGQLGQGDTQFDQPLLQTKDLDSMVRQVLYMLVETGEGAFF